MSRFWRNFSIRWQNQQMEAERKEKLEKEQKEAEKLERKELRDTLKVNVKAIEGVIKDLRKNRPPEPTTPYPEDLNWWFEDLIALIDNLALTVDYLLEREEKLDV